jgi:DNA topoisomerase IA
MLIKFTKHALERMKIRSITKEEIIDAINNPEKEINDSFGNIIAHKMKKKYLLRVFYYIKEDSKIIITAYKTSKMDKYI